MNYLQFIANLSALIVIGWIYAAYVKNLRSIAQSKDDQIIAVEKNLKLWRDKAELLEKKTPEYLEKVLSDRIKIREDELSRLKLDYDKHTKEIQARNSELSNLKEQLENAKDLGRSVVVYDSESDDEVIIPASELELIEIGEVFVDSATLIIADPSYINSDWHQEEYIPLPRIYRDKITLKQYEYAKDFHHYEDMIPDFGKSMNELIEIGEVEKVEMDEPDYKMSFAGSLYASGNKTGYGALKFKNGETGAGISVRTVYGDGVYPVFGEKYKGAIVRVYINLQ
jgi:hypothetical protein